MDTEINKNTIIGHIAGLTDTTKNELHNYLKKSSIYKMIEIIDVDIITNKIIEDNNMELLFSKFEFYTEKSKNLNYTQIENKAATTKAKQLEKKMFQYWKVRMEYYINKISSTSTKKILLIGYLSFFKNHKIYINLNINTKFFIKVDYDNHAKTIISHNLRNFHDDIVNGTFDLNYLDASFLIKKRVVLQNIYSKINYIIMSLPNVINTIELNCQISIPETLYYASFTKYDKKIPIADAIVHVYNEEWLALTAITNNIEKGINNNVAYINISKEQSQLLNKKGYLYEITNTENFLPFPTKHNIYKYFTVKPIKINRMLEIDNILNQFKQLKINININ